MIRVGDLKAIKGHDLVSSLNLIDEDEIEIKFIDGYSDLIISLKPEMTTDHLMTVFYYYIENFKMV